MQKKWVELFEKVIGRKPSPAEFMAGKACGFDLKQIHSIINVVICFINITKPKKGR